MEVRLLTSSCPAASQGVDYSSSPADLLLKSDAQISRFKKTFIWSCSNPRIGFQLRVKSKDSKETHIKEPLCVDLLVDLLPQHVLRMTNKRHVAVSHIHPRLLSGKEPKHVIIIKSRATTKSTSCELQPETPVS